MPLMISVTPVHEHIDLTPLLLGEVMEQGLSCCVSANSNGVDIDPLVFQGLLSFEFAESHSNAASDGAWLGHNLVC